MDEQFLHYIWKYQKFVKAPVQTTGGHDISIFSTGSHNHDSGPDFEEARIKIGDIEWAGQVEVHINSSDWIRHNHQTDAAYDNVILHVVWNHDKEITVNSQPLPTLELKNNVDLELLNKYKRHIHAVDEIPCSSQLPGIHSLTISGMLDRTMIDRLASKAERILQILSKTNNDWEEATYRTLAPNFGFSTNKEAFVRLTELLPFSRLKKALQSAKSTEALLFGQAGFLDEVQDDYQKSLKEEFSYLRQKFQLVDPMVKPQWKFGKLRPANFPSVRIAQLASLLHRHPKLFSLLIETKDLKVLKKELLVEVSDYWQTHYDFGKARKTPSASMGISSFENLLINSVAPLLAAYSKYTDNQDFMNRGVELLESLASEKNRITKKWGSVGIKPKSAFDSQALIELFSNYCKRRRCLQCNIGVEILTK
ncbi:MAG: DUF2851 family protein [Ekhidna sp.]|uniref:DUF2851 family protein n=1 Tax=Ekhidna sp. TaxID=2608089 RepID=UPI0032EC098A